ncbi:MAG: FAD/NAD(P)-binding protein [Rhodobacterales bacterium]|nr:FAD/NAD(P)-binding protein [Rhodobacterales bacterium]
MNTAIVDPMIPVPYQVRSFQKELSDTFTIELTPASGRRPFHFKPGQFNMLYAYGTGEVPISMSGDPADPSKVVHTIRAVGTVTDTLMALREGDNIGLRGPFGSSWPVEAAEGHDLIIVTGGIGLAPLRPAIYHVLKHRKKYGKVCIFYGARTPEDILFRKDLESWRGRFDMYADVTVDRGTGDWAGPVGVVTNLITRGRFDPHHTVAFVCGPEIMMRFSVQTLNGLGVTNDRIHVSMERNMKCAVGLCGFCQFGPTFVCKDGPVFRFDRIQKIFPVREL